MKTVNWKRHFDHAYCICFLGSKNYMLKRKRLFDEFKRVGLMDEPGFLSVEYTTPDPWEKVIADRVPKRVYGCEESNVGFCSLGLATARLFRQALALGYKRVLVMEDDIAFLRDLAELGAVIGDTPDRSLVMYDKFLPWDLAPDDYGKFVDAHRINRHFYQGDNQPTTSGAMYAVNRDAMKYYVDRFENPKDGPRAADTHFICFPDRAVAVKNAAIQILYASSMAPTYCNGPTIVNSHNNAYRPAGLKFSDYEIPFAYDYDTSPVDLSKVMPPAEPAAEWTEKTCFVVTVEGLPVWWDRAAFTASSLHAHLAKADADVCVLGFGQVPDCRGTRHLRKAGFRILSSPHLEELCRKAHRGHNRLTPIVWTSAFIMTDMPELERYRRVVVVDADIEAVDHLDDLCKVEPLHGIAAVVDAGWPHWKGRREVGGGVPDSMLGDNNPKGLRGALLEPYVNAGFVLFDRKYLDVGDFRARRDWVLAKDAEWPMYYPWQDCLNLSMDVDILPFCFNVQVWRMGTKFPDGRIVHYIGAGAVDRVAYDKRVEGFYGALEKLTGDQTDTLPGRTDKKGAEMETGHDEPEKTGPKGKLKICVYAIARNECKFVDRWMDSMSEADGVYVLDTGSTDGTVDRLRARGAHVETKTYDPWRFDVPRNDSMALCPADTDVYVCTDLDEVLNKGWRKVLEDAWLGYENAHGARPTRAWYDYIWGWAPDGKTPAVKFRYDKFHDSNYKWVCPVHEVLERRDESRPDRWLDTSGILLEHHPDPAKSRGSYLGLLELAVKERPQEARMAFYLAREYSFYRRWDDMIEWCKKYIDMPGGWNAERASAMELLGRTYWSEKGDHDLAELWFRRACDEAPGQREAACTWADLLLADGKADKAVNVLVKTLERTRGKSPPDNHTTRMGLWDASFYDKLGLALWRAGRYDEARVAYRVAVLKYPDNEFLKRQLAACGESGPDRLARLLAASYPKIKKGGSNGMEQKDAHA